MQLRNAIGTLLEGSQTPAQVGQRGRSVFSRWLREAWSGNADGRATAVTNDPPAAQTPTCPILRSGENSPRLPRSGRKDRKSFFAIERLSFPHEERIIRGNAETIHCPSADPARAAQKTISDGQGNAMAAIKTA